MPTGSASISGFKREGPHWRLETLEHEIFFSCWLRVIWLLSTNWIQFWQFWRFGCIYNGSIACLFYLCPEPINWTNQLLQRGPDRSCACASCRPTCPPSAVRCPLFENSQCVSTAAWHRKILWTPQILFNLFADVCCRYCESNLRCTRLCKIWRKILPFHVWAGIWTASRDHSRPLDHDPS